MKRSADILVVGGGVIGLCLALSLHRRYPDQRIVVLEKEESFGEHASGRNSGVLHAGFYYTAESLKARFTRDGNRLLTEYCVERGIALNRCGKLVVARDERDLPGLDELLRRGKANAVEVAGLTEREAREIEPRVRTFERALFSPTTSTVDPREVVAAYAQEAEAAGVGLVRGVRYLGRSGRGGVLTSEGEWEAGYLVNAAGLYADRVARDFGFSQDYRILPFKGLYLYSTEPPGSLRTNVYPVPDLQNPFLGVHFTVTAQGRVNIGPTAIPAFWREHYRGVENFRLSELVEVLGREAGLFLRDSFGFRGLAFREMRKYFRSHMVAEAARLVSGVDARHYTEWGPPGIRAQLLDIKQHKLEMDLRYEGDEQSFHVLNAVSPAFTCAIPFSRFLVEEIDRLTGGGGGRPGPVVGRSES